MRVWIVSVLLLMCGSAVAHSQVVNFLVDAQWLASDYHLGPETPDNDDLVFDTAPSAGSMSLLFQVDTSDRVFIDREQVGTSHDWFGYGSVSLASPVVLGSARWDNGSQFINLSGPITGFAARLWTDTDILTGDPTAFAIRIHGAWREGTAMLAIGGVTSSGITRNMLMAEYYAGEYIQTRDYNGHSSAVPEPTSIVVLCVGLACLALKRKKGWA